MREQNLSGCPIGVFDSGLGGLTAFRELRRLLPHEDIIYFGDTGRVPYGTKSRETIIRYARQDVDFLLGQKVKMVIAACGTVSANIPADFADTLKKCHLVTLEDVKNIKTGMKLRGILSKAIATLL